MRVEERESEGGGESVPQCDGPGNGVIAMNDGEDPSKELVHTCDLVQVTLTLLHYFQDIQAKQVRAIGSEKERKEEGEVGDVGEREQMKNGERRKKNHIKQQKTAGRAWEQG